jgi:NADPH-dependent ferric siderophore reductase
MGTAARVTEVEFLTPTLKKITWVHESARTWRPGDKIKVHVADGVMRSYTPSWVDAQTGEMELVAHVHGKGAGSAWAEALAPGDTFAFKGPVKSFPIDLEEHPPWAVFFGDETTLGLASALRESAVAGRVMGAVELEPGAAGVSEVMGLGLDELRRGAARGDALVAYAEQMALPEGEGVFWISGEADSVVSVRKALLARGVARRSMRIKSYWSARGKARRKQLDLQMKLT